MFGKPVGKLGAVGGRTLVQRAISILRRYGPDAHIHLPGVGMLNGLQAGNYLDSAGTTVGALDQPVGLVLDAAGGLGVELVTNGANLVNTSGWTQSDANSVFSANAGKLRLTSPNASAALGYQILTTVAGKTYFVSVVAYAGTGTSRVLIGTAAGSGNLFSETASSASARTVNLYFVAATTSSYLQFTQSTATAGLYTEFEAISVREVTGIAASQPTTSNKCILRQTGGRYNWVFDATDLLTATFPAGNESVTVIDALGTGQVTTTGVNVVGAYSMGPSVTLYGRMIVKGALSASELATLQSYANRLAGV